MGGKLMLLFGGLVVCAMYLAYDMAISVMPAIDQIAMVVLP